MAKMYTLTIKPLLDYPPGSLLRHICSGLSTGDQLIAMQMIQTLLKSPHLSDFGRKSLTQRITNTKGWPDGTAA